MSWNFGFTSGAGSNGGGDSSGDGGFLDGYTLSDAIDQGLQGWQQYNQYQLAQQALNSPRPATVQFLPNGQAAVATGGGALLPSLSGVSSSWVWIIAILLIVVLVLKR